MKKILLSFLITSLLVSLTGCSTKNQQADMRTIIDESSASQENSNNF